jgi:hypothetical protein
LRLLLVTCGVKAVILPVDIPREVEGKNTSDMLEMLSNGKEQLEKDGVAIKTYSRIEAIKHLFFLQWDLEAYEIYKLRK